MVKDEDLKSCRRETGGEEGLLETRGGGGGLRGGLDNDGVSGEQRRYNGVDHAHVGVVPAEEGKWTGKGRQRATVSKAVS